MDDASGRQAHLSEPQYEMFQAQRKRVIGGVLAIFAVVGVMVISQKLLRLEFHPAVHFALFVPITLWTMIQMFKFKCPQCGVTPMMTRPSFSSGEVAVTGYVALRPRTCHKCGVSFAAPPQ